MATVFECDWEDGTDEQNSGGTYEFDSIVDSNNRLSFDTGSNMWDDNSLKFSGSDSDAAFVLEACAESAIGLRLGIKVTDGATDYQIIFEMSGASGSIAFQVRLNDSSGPTIEVWTSDNGWTLRQVGSAVSISLNTIYQILVKWQKNTSNGCSFKIMAEDGTTLVGSEQALSGYTTINANSDEFYLGPSAARWQTTTIYFDKLLVTDSYAYPDTYQEAGGETYNESISEKINLADSERAGMIYGLGISESFRLGESMGPRTVLNVSRTDSINLIDAIKASLIYAMRVGEAISLRDIQVTEAIIPLQISEGITLSDSVKGQFVFSPRLSDRFSLADAITAGFLFYLPLNEVISLTDSLIIELVGGAQIFNESLTEKISIAESISAILRYYADIREQVNLAEVIHAASVMNLSLAEFLNLKDAAAEGVRIFFENLTERLSLSDSAAAMFIHALALAESFNVADQEKAALTFNLSVTDRFQLTDALAAIFRFGLVITENMTVGEIIVGTATSATITIARGKASIFKIGVTAQIADKPGKGEVH